jgi:hypothetical protein
MRRKKHLDRWLAAVVGGHILITVLHAAAHLGAHVPLTLVAAVFVLIVIQIGPPAGLAVSLSWPRAGAWVVAASMTGALVFGLVNHFVIPSPDHVSQVTEAWRPLFASTAWLLVLTEAAGVAVGVRRATSPCVEVWYRKEA